MGGFETFILEGLKPSNIKAPLTRGFYVRPTVL